MGPGYLQNSGNPNHPSPGKLEDKEIFFIFSRFFSKLYAGSKIFQK
jgi:hypothetical protein